MPKDEDLQQAASDPRTRFLQIILHDGEPDWNAITFDVLCSRCGYNLKLLPQPRCPECGLEFEWQHVLNRAGFRSDFLFEHNWRIKPVRSYVKTVYRALRPVRFWKSISIHYDAAPGPLWFLLFCSIVLFHLILAAGVLIVTRLLSVPFLRYSGAEWFKNVPDILNWVHPLRNPFNYIRLPLMLLATWCAVLVLLCSLRQTLCHHRVRWVQILRVAAFTAGPAAILGGMILLVTVCFFAIPMDWYANQFGPVWWNSRVGFRLYDDATFMACCLTFYPLTLLLLIPFLAVGLGKYLKLPHPWLMAAVSAVAAYLLTTLLLVLLNELRTHSWL